jgi:hypothetical protein
LATLSASRTPHSDVLADAVDVDAAAVAAVARIAAAPGRGVLGDLRVGDRQVRVQDADRTAVRSAVAAEAAADDRDVAAADVVDRAACDVLAAGGRVVVREAARDDVQASAAQPDRAAAAVRVVAGHAGAVAAR